MSPNQQPDQPSDVPVPLPSRRGGAAGAAEADPALTLPPHFVNGRIVMSDPDPKWPYLFQREADRICEALGDAALAVEHVGSTAVPGLMAKPCLDVLLLVADTADEDAYLPPLESAGYTLLHREPELDGHSLLRGPDINTNVHVFPDGAPEPERMLLFRDRLRTDEDDRKLYASTKHKLAGRTWDSVDDYAGAKAEVVEQIIARAREARGPESAPAG